MSDDGTDIRDYLMSRTKLVWENNIGEIEIDQWRDNFKGEFSGLSEERRTADELLVNFIYYNAKEIEFLCKAVFSMFRQEVLRNLVLTGTPLDNANKDLTDYIAGCRFVGVGRPSESGYHLLYHLRQQNSLPVDQFNVRRIDNGVHSLIFFDDFLGTGDSAIETWKSKEYVAMRKRLTSLNSYLMVLVAARAAVSRIEDETEMKVICPQVLDEEYRVFSARSLIFPERDRRASARKICELYGMRLAPDSPLGYGDAQLLIGFHHNVPDNTLPVVWSNAHGWQPLIKRRLKYSLPRRRRKS